MHAVPSFLPVRRAGSLAGQQAHPTGSAPCTMRTAGRRSNARGWQGAHWCTCRACARGRPARPRPQTRAGSAGRGAASRAAAAPAPPRRARGPAVRPGPGAPPAAQQPGPSAVCCGAVRQRAQGALPLTDGAPGEVPGVHSLCLHMRLMNLAPSLPSMPACGRPAQLSAIPALALPGRPCLLMRPVAWCASISAMFSCTTRYRGAGNTNVLVTMPCQLAHQRLHVLIKAAGLCLLHAPALRGPPVLLVHVICPASTCTSGAPMRLQPTDCPSSAAMHAH